jgi:hypothetical protein
MTVVLRVKTTAGWSPMVQETGKQRGERQRQTPEMGDFFFTSALSFVFGNYYLIID